MGKYLDFYSEYFCMWFAAPFACKDSKPLKYMEQILKQTGQPYIQKATVLLQHK